MDEYNTAMSELESLEVNIWVLKYYELFKTTLNWPEGFPFIPLSSLEEPHMESAKTFNYEFCEAVGRSKYLISMDLRCLVFE